MPVDNTQVRRLKPNEIHLFQKLILLFQEVFEEESQPLPERDYLANLLAREDFQVFVVTQNQHLLGGLTAYELRKYTAQISELYIYDLAVRAEFQRRGLGSDLIQGLRQHNQPRGIDEIFVAAHAEDRGAFRFYESLGAQAESVVHFNFDEDSP